MVWHVLVWHALVWHVLTSYVCLFSGALVDWTSYVYVFEKPFVLRLRVCWPESWFLSDLVCKSTRCLLTLTVRVCGRQQVMASASVTVY